MSSLRVTIPKAFKPLLSERARYKGYYGGRGSAKSHSFAQALLILGAQRPIRVLCCREIQRSIKDSVKRLLDDKIDATGLADFYSSTDIAITGTNGTAFIFAGLWNNPDTIKSMEGIDYVWIEEAHRVSQRSLEILLPTIRKPGSEIWCSWNPDSESDPVDRMFRTEPKPENMISVYVTYADNPYFPDVLREEMEWDRRRDPDKFAHVWQGDYRQQSESRVFNNWRVEEFETPDDARFYLGADWGFANDPSALVRCFVQGRTLYVDHEAYGVGVEIDHLPALFDKVPGARKWNDDAERWEPVWRIRADNARPETISYIRRCGFDIVGAKKGKGSVEDGVEFLKSFDIVVHPRCRHTVDELTHFRYKTDKHTGEVIPILEDDHNHIIDAMRYATELTRRRGSWRPA